jgi:hypothetical protein
MRECLSSSRHASSGDRTSLSRAERAPDRSGDHRRASAGFAVAVGTARGRDAMDGKDDCRRRQTTSEGLNTRVLFDFRDLGRLSPRPSPSPVPSRKSKGGPRTSIQKVNGFPAMTHTLDSRMRVRPSWDARRGFHRASTSGNVDLGYSASARRVMRHRHHRCS